MTDSVQLKLRQRATIMLKVCELAESHLRHHHVDVPWIGHHTYSYLPNSTPILQLFLRRHRRRKL